MEGSSTQQVHVHVEHRLSRLGTNIQYSTVPIFNVALARNLGSRELTLSDQRGIFADCFL